MIIYFRRKDDGKYFSAYPVSTDRSESFDVRVFWVFKEVFNEWATFYLDSSEIPEKYQPCSPFEAIYSQTPA